MVKTERLTIIDIAKGIGILLVVFGHQIDYFHAPVPGAYPFIYLFHVPLFFFLSGLFFREQENLWTTVKKKFVRLYVPYLLANIFFFFVEMVRVCKLGNAYDGDLGWRNLWNAVFGLWPVPSMFSRPTWFILVLFRICILYKLIQYLAGGRKWIMAIVSVALGIVGAVVAPSNCMLGQTLVALPFLSLGHICGTKFIADSKVFNVVPSAVLSVILLPVLFVISRHQQTNIAVNLYDSTVLLFTGALLGIALILFVSKLIEKLPLTTKVLSFVGKYTLPIMIWHIFLMKVLFTAAEYAGLGSNPLAYIAAFAVAVAVPCAARYFLGRINTKVKD